MTKWLIARSAGEGPVVPASIYTGIRIIERLTCMRVGIMSGRMLGCKIGRGVVNNRGCMVYMCGS